MPVMIGGRRETQLNPGWFFDNASEAQWPSHPILSFASNSENVDNTGTASFSTASEAIVETGLSAALATQEIDEQVVQPEDTLTNEGVATFALEEAIAEVTSSFGTVTVSIGETATDRELARTFASRRYLSWPSGIGHILRPLTIQIGDVLLNEAISTQELLEDAEVCDSTGHCTCVELSGEETAMNVGVGTPSLDESYPPVVETVDAWQGVDTSIGGGYPVSCYAWHELDESSTGPAQPPAIGPTPTDAWGNGTSVVIEFNHSLDTGSIPAAASFTVHCDVGTINVTGVAISGRRVTLTIASTIGGCGTASVDYINPYTGQIKNTDGLDAASFWEFPIRIGVTPPAPSPPPPRPGYGKDGITLEPIWFRPYTLATPEDAL